MSEPDPPALAGLWGHVRDLVRLAGPVVVARSGVMILILADTLMVGRFGSSDLAFLGIAMAVVMVLIVSSIGLLMGTLVVTAAAHGSGRPADCGAAWRRSLPFAFGIGLTGAIICAFGVDLLLLFGQPEPLAAGGGRVLRILGCGMPGFLVFVTSSFFLEGIRRPVPGMLIMLAANVVNVGLNCLLIYGNLGVPTLGAEGAAWATTAVRTGIAVAIVAYILTMRDHTRYAVRSAATGGWQAGAQQRRIGYAAGSAIGVESLAFGIVNLFAGLLGPIAIAAYSIAFNLFALAFMVAIGLGAATAVRVGMAWGRGDHASLAAAGWTGLAVTSAAMAAIATLFAGLPDGLVAAYTDDVAVAGLGATLLAFSAWILIFDGGQAVMANALRGRGETWVTTGLQTFAYFGVMVPGAWLLAFTADRGILGLYEGILVASIASMILLCARFHWLSRRDRRVATVPGAGGVR